MDQALEWMEAVLVDPSAVDPPMVSLSQIESNLFDSARAGNISSSINPTFTTIGNELDVDSNLGGMSGDGVDLLSDDPSLFAPTELCTSVDNDGAVNEAHDTMMLDGCNLASIQEELEDIGSSPFDLSFLLQQHQQQINWSEETLAFVTPDLANGTSVGQTTDEATTVVIKTEPAEEDDVDCIQQSLAKLEESLNKIPKLRKDDGATQKPKSVKRGGRKKKVADTNSSADAMALTPIDSIPPARDPIDMTAEHDLEDGGIISRKRKVRGGRTTKKAAIAIADSSKSSGDEFDYDSSTTNGNSGNKSDSGKGITTSSGLTLSFSNFVPSKPMDDELARQYMMLKDPALTSKERRQLRNKLSARSFRERRKEYIETLEGEIQKCMSETETVKKELDEVRSERDSLKDLVNDLVSRLQAWECLGRAAAEAGAVPSTMKASQFLTSVTDGVPPASPAESVVAPFSPSKYPSSPPLYPTSAPSTPSQKARAQLSSSSAAATSADVISSLLKDRPSPAIPHSQTNRTIKVHTVTIPPTDLSLSPLMKPIQCPPTFGFNLSEKDNSSFGHSFFNNSSGFSMPDSNNANNNLNGLSFTNNSILKQIASLIDSTTNTTTTTTTTTTATTTTTKDSKTGTDESGTNPICDATLMPDMMQKSNKDDCIGDSMLPGKIIGLVQQAKKLGDTEMVKQIVIDHIFGGKVASGEIGETMIKMMVIWLLLSVPPSATAAI
jgi:hypothetical protein